jgi:hypothetical protein
MLREPSMRLWSSRIVVRGRVQLQTGADAFPPDHLMSDSSCSRQWINDESGVRLTEATCIQTCPNKQNEAQVLRKREAIQSCF